jgi:hypothetical protein
MISKEKARKAIRFSLLFYPLFVGLMGTISLVVLVFWGIPEHHLQSQIQAIIIFAGFIYGTCAASLAIRYLFFKKDTNGGNTSGF